MVHVEHEAVDEILRQRTERRALPAPVEHEEDLETERFETTHHRVRQTAGDEEVRVSCPFDDVIVETVEDFPVSPPLPKRFQHFLQPFLSLASGVRTSPP